MRPEEQGLDQNSSVSCRANSPHIRARTTVTVTQCRSSFLGHAAFALLVARELSSILGCTRDHSGFSDLNLPPAVAAGVEHTRVLVVSFDATFSANMT